MIFREFLNENLKEIILGGLIGAVYYFLQKNISPQDMSILQSSLSNDKIANIVSSVGVSINIQQLIFFILIGVGIAMLVSKFIVKFK